MTSTDNQSEGSAELRRRAEEIARGKAAKPSEALSPEETQQTLHELRVHQIELEMQNEELRRAQGELDASRARYFDLFDLAPVGYFTLSEQGLILEANLTVATLLGVARGALVKQPLTRHILPEDQGIYYLHRKALFETGAPQVCEFRMLRANGDHFWARVEATATHDADGAPVCRAVMSDITARKQAEDSLRENELRYRTLADSGQALIWTAGPDRQCDYVNQTWLTFTGRTLEQELGDGWAEGVHPDDRARCVEIYTTAFDRRERFSILYRLRRYDGEYRWIQDDGTPRYDSRGTFLGFIGHCLDITEQKQAETQRTMLEAQIRQSQKMEAIGRLAGGVAHDFNNSIQVILTYIDLALGAVSPDSPVRPHIEEIEKAAQHSAGLTRQLLAFARKQIIAPCVLDINTAIDPLLAMLRRLIGEEIALCWKPAAPLWSVKMDPVQIDQVLTNLVLNARDALALPVSQSAASRQTGGIGTIAIATENAECDDAFCRAHAGFSPGQYVRVTVSDDGWGMDQAAQERLFEPFYSTKPLGQSGGLGLATVYGIVKQNGGYVHVQSAPGQGTTFSIYLPRCMELLPPVEPPSHPATAPTGTETVLVVEDEPALLRSGCLLLEGLGYTVLVAAGPIQALQLAAEHAGDIHLLLTDVIMPELNGRDLWRRLHAQRPGLRCVFMSGYTADIIAPHSVLDDSLHFLQKPFTKMDLAVKVREALE